MTKPTPLKIELQVDGFRRASQSMRKFGRQMAADMKKANTASAKLAVGLRGISKISFRAVIAGMSRLSSASLTAAAASARLMRTIGGSAMRRAASGLRGIGTAVGGIAAAGGLAGGASAVANARSTAELARFAELSNTDIGTLQALQLISRESGRDSEAGLQIAREFRLRATEYAQGLKGSAFDLFEAVQLSEKDVAKLLEQGTGTLLREVLRLSEQANLDQTFVGDMIAGGDSEAAALSVGKLADAYERLAKSGALLTNAEIDSFKSFNSTLNDLTLTMRGFAQEVGAALVPALNQIGQSVTATLGENQEAISLRLQDFGKSLGRVTGEIIKVVGGGESDIGLLNGVADTVKQLGIAAGVVDGKLSPAFKGFAEVAANVKSLFVSLGEYLTGQPISDAGWADTFTRMRDAFLTVEAVIKRAGDVAATVTAQLARFLPRQTSAEYVARQNQLRGGAGPMVPEVTAGQLVGQVAARNAVSSMLRAFGFDEKAAEIRFATLGPVQTGAPQVTPAQRQALSGAMTGGDGGTINLQVADGAVVEAKVQQGYNQLVRDLQGNRGIR